MSNIAYLQPVEAHRDDPDAGVLEMLEALLESARAGRVRGLAVAYVGNGGTATGWAGEGTADVPIAMLGAIEMLKIRFGEAIVVDDE